MTYEYFYGTEGEQFSFYRIPKLLFLAPEFKQISVEAKVLYGLLLDRMSLSAKNGWLDEQGRVYIIFSIVDIMEAMGCADQKAGKLLQELEQKAGLIVRKRQGLGKPNLIYVKNFLPSQASRFKNRENHDSGNVIITNQEPWDSRSNNTESNKTEYNELETSFASLMGRHGREPMRSDEMMARRADYENLLKDNMPVIVKALDRDAATILMVDSNLQRETILPSERAKAYKMKLEALKRQGARTDLTLSQSETKLTEKTSDPNAEKPSISAAFGTCAQIGHKLDGQKSVEILADEAGTSRMQIRRFIRLTELTPKLQQMVDEKRLGFTPAVEVSYLKPAEQELLLDAMESEQAVPSLSQAQRIKKLSQDGKLTDDAMRQVMREQKKPDCWDVTLSGQKLQKYFPKSFTPRQIESAIFKMLESMYQKRQQSKGQSR